MDRIAGAENIDEFSELVETDRHLRHEKRVQLLAQMNADPDI